jgi:hypothetical protein
MRLPSMKRTLLFANELRRNEKKTKSKFNMNERPAPSDNSFGA